MTVFKHISVDIETCSTRPGGVILSIVAMEFNPNAGILGKGFLVAIDLASSMRHGFVLDADTLKWWMLQDEAARVAAFTGSVPIDKALGDLARYVTHSIGDNEVPIPRGNAYIWGHGASFDPPFLEAAYRRFSIPCPWKYTNIRDTRTIFDLAGVSVDRSVGQAHNALVDAENQAAAVCVAYRKLGFGSA